MSRRVHVANIAVAHPHLPGRSPISLQHQRKIIVFLVGNGKLGNGGEESSIYSSSRAIGKKALGVGNVRPSTPPMQHALGLVQGSGGCETACGWSTIARWCVERCKADAFASVAGCSGVGTSIGPLCCWWLEERLRGPGGGAAKVVRRCRGKRRCRCWTPCCE
jgi:hypothetical protein